MLADREIIDVHYLQPQSQDTCKLTSVSHKLFSSSKRCSHVVFFFNQGIIVIKPIPLNSIDKFCPSVEVSLKPLVRFVRSNRFVGLTIKS